MHLAAMLGLARSVIYFDIGVGGTPLGRLQFALAPAEILPHTVENMRSLTAGERCSIDPKLTYTGCAFAWSPSYLAGPQYKFAHVCDGRGKRAIAAADDGQALSRCAVRAFGGATYYGLRLCPDGDDTEEASTGTTTSAGTVLTMPVVGPGRGKSRFSIVRVAASPPAWKERLLINAAVVGSLISGEKVVEAMSMATSPPVVLASGEFSLEEASEALAAVSRLRGGYVRGTAAAARAVRAPVAATQPAARSAGVVLCAGAGGPAPRASSQSSSAISGGVSFSGDISRSWDASLPASEVVPNLMRAFEANDEPPLGAGLRTFWDWTHELYRGRPVNGHGDFSLFASRARHSELALLMGASSWAMEPCFLVGDGAKYATHVASVFPAGDLDGRRARRYLFQLRREERPPYNGAWSVWGIIVSDACGDLQDLSGGF